MEARSGIEAQQQDYYQQQALQDRQEAAQKDSLFEELSIREHFQRRAEKREQGAQRDEEKRMLRAAEPARGTGEWWKWYMQAHPNQAESFLGKRGNAFGAAQRLLQQGEFQSPDVNYGGIALNELRGGNTLARATRGSIDAGGGTTSAARKKLGLAEVLKRYSGPRYSKLRAALLYQAGRAGKK
jgi:hypothetical protein